MPLDFPGLVLDASALLALVLTDEEGGEVEELTQDIIRRNGQLLVPPLFWYEVLNGLAAACIRSRITQEELSAIESDLSVLPVSVDQSPPVFVRQRIREYALRYSLTVYDAAYVELAARYRLPLKTFDAHILALKETFSFIR